MKRVSWQSLEVDEFTTKVDVEDFKVVLDTAVRIARNFGTQNGYCGLTEGGGPAGTCAD